MTSSVRPLAVMPRVAPTSPESADHLVRLLHDNDESGCSRVRFGRKRSRIMAKAEKLAAQGGAIPVFLKLDTNQWEYKGRYELMLFSKNLPDFRQKQSLQIGMTLRQPSSFGRQGRKAENAMAKEQILADRRTGTVEITFPGSSVWTYRLLSGLVSASDAVFWLAKIYVVTMLIIAKLSLDIIGYACEQTGSRRRW